MSQRSLWITVPLVCWTPLVLVLLAGCGATSTQQPIASSTDGASSASVATAPHGPQLGYLWDATQRNLYPVLGVAGAAHYGSPLLAAGSNYMAGAVSGSAAGNPGWALLLDSTGTLDILTLPSTTPTVVTTRVAPDAGISFAPAGGYALVLSKATNTLLLIGGLPAQPRVSALAAPAGTAWAGAAVSDRGTVLAGWTAANGVQLGTLSAGGAAAFANISSWGGAAFVPGMPAAGQEQAVIADGGTGLLTRLAGVGGSAPTAAQMASGGKLQKPAAVAVSGDGLWAFAADSAKQQVVRFDLAGSTPAIAIACACQPARLAAMPGNTLFEVGADQTGQPAWLLDGHALAPRTFFVPALAATVASPSVTTAGTKPTAKAMRGAQ